MNFSLLHILMNFFDLLSKIIILFLLMIFTISSAISILFVFNKKLHIANYYFYIIFS